MEMKMVDLIRIRDMLGTSQTYVRRGMPYLLKNNFKLRKQQQFCCAHSHASTHYMISTFNVS